MTILGVKKAKYLVTNIKYELPSNIDKVVDCNHYFWAKYKPLKYYSELTLKTYERISCN